MVSENKDRYRTATAIAVLLVAGIAAVVSYLHVARLALEYGQEPLAAYLLPLSIDGVVATSSLVMLRAARAGVSTPWLARTVPVKAVSHQQPAQERRVAEVDHGMNSPA